MRKLKLFFWNTEKMIIPARTIEMFTHEHFITCNYTHRKTIYSKNTLIHRDQTLFTFLASLCESIIDEKMITY